MTGLLTGPLARQQPLDACAHQGRATWDVWRPIVFDGLPAVCIEVDLGAPPDVLEGIDGDGGPRTVFMLVRLRTHPLGTVILDSTGDLRWLTHASTVWSSMRDAANAHLVADGPPAVGDWTALAGPLTSPPRCVSRSRTVLANPPRITVVVATRDRPQLLRTCLDALHQPSAVAMRRHDRDITRLLDQAYSYGVGLGVAMTGVLLREPRIWAACLSRWRAARLPAEVTMAAPRAMQARWRR